MSSHMLLVYVKRPTFVFIPKAFPQSKLFSYNESVNWSILLEDLFSHVSA